MRLVKARGFLVRPGKRRQLRILIKAAQERNRDWRPRAADIVMVAIIDRWRRRRIRSAQAIRYDDRWIPAQIRRNELQVR